jgi:DNA-binding MarR family transcriptional regulator
MCRATYHRYGVEPLTDYTGFLLRNAFLHTTRHMTAHFGPDQHPRDAGVLMTLVSSGPTSQQELVARLNVNRTVMVKLIDSLERRRWVARVRNPDDRRAYALQATPAGREALEQMLPRLDEAEAQLTAPLSAAESDRLKRLLRALLHDPPEELAYRLGFLITKTHHLFHERANAEVAGLGIQIRHFGALKQLAGGVPSQRELADRLGVTTPVIVELVDVLEAKGLVERRRDPSDRRSNVLAVTPEGQTAVDEATQRLRAANGELTAPIGVEGDRELRSLLRTFLGVP